MSRIATAVGIVAALVGTSAAWADDFAAPRTSFGHPDLSGTWTNNNATPVRLLSLGDEDEGDDSQDARCGDADLVHGLLESRGASPEDYAIKAIAIEPRFCAAFRAVR